MTRFPSPLLIGALLVSACTTVGPDYRAPTTQQLSIPDSYFGAAPAPSATEAATWWHSLDDPLLDSLVDRALPGNLDLAVATARLRQAREGVVQARAGRVPTVGISGDAGQNVATKGSDNRSFSVGVDASWEADLFGGVTRTIEAANANADAAGYDAAATRVSVVAEIVSNYVQARLAQQRLAVARETLAITEDNLQIAGWRVQAGLASSLDVEQARGQRAQTAATIPTLEGAFSSAAYRLGVLTGQAPAALIGELQTARAIPAAPAQVAVGIPADTLRQRPDVRAAERSLAVETARIGIAEAELRPGLRLTGNIGTSALSIGGLVDQVVGGLFAGLSQTLFDGGRLRSQVRSQEAAAEAALATYRQTVLTSLEDVENGLVALDTAKRRQTEFSAALEAASNQEILARSQYRAGLSDFQALLEAERALLSAREGLLTSRADQTLAVVQLYRALGGGWDPTTLPEDQTR
ncbi:efflux transporter outer membrane subunit [Sphingosinicella sp. BN140058]|uniref:efflux transporter outer membrane subunit n=1 Tax=Sphingosinicella sp. BN140058 TaxID=1892855 RepID=UPI0010116D91|nr:efflux transporter outer membrane subunit [Sphingosinicella sp. BN140058]QAY79971.1 efflux transporter outer membrane subunit [Sphingosinicella sp. BN140058]